MSLWETEVIDKTNFRYVSDGLKDCFEKWRYVNPVLINAPTGSGKNTFILENIIPSLKHFEEILILGNRTALNLQMKRTLYERMEMPPISDGDLIEMEQFGNVWVISYQRILQYLTSTHNPIPSSFKTLSYIIMDEAHFFLSDARFNPETGAIFHALMNSYPYAKKIYMTATPSHIENLISTTHRDWYTYRCRINDSVVLSNYKKCSNGCSYGLHTYRFQADYSNCKFHFFSEWDILAQHISESPSAEKWLVFVKSLSEGEILQEALSKTDIPKKQITSIDASKKDSDIYRKIVRREKFNEKVLISTSVIDNGVNIKDSTLKHVVIHTLDPISMVQMAGRKRREPDERVHFYFKIPATDEVQSAINSVPQLMSFIDNVQRDTGGDYLQNRWGRLSVEEQGLLLAQNYSQYQGNPPVFTFQINLFAIEKLRIDHGELELLKDAVTEESDDEYKQLVLNYFGNPTTVDQTFEVSVSPEWAMKKRASLIEWLEYKVNQGLLTAGAALAAEKELAEFYQGITKGKMPQSSKTAKTSRVVAFIGDALEELNMAEKYEFRRAPSAPKVKSKPPAVDDTSNKSSETKDASKEQEESGFRWEFIRKIEDCQSTE